MGNFSEEDRLRSEAAIRESYDLRVYVVGGGYQYLQMFYDAGFRGARSVDEAHIICFTGGEDVDPSLYDEEPIPETYFNPERDKWEAYIYGEALALKKPMVGICRGAQFLNVMCGGSLWQDVNNHAVGRPHDVLDVRTGETLKNMTSTHHQQMIPGKGAEIIAMASLSTVKKSMSQVMMRDKPENDDTEVVWYPEGLCLCFQPHPEYNHGECRDFFLDLVDNYVLPAC